MIPTSISSLFLVLFVSTIFFFFFFFFSSSRKKKNSNLPPSPLKLPILGNLHQLGSFPHRSLQALSHKHGPLMLLHMGHSPTLVVSSRAVAEEIMKTHDLVFSGRPTSYMADRLLYGKDLAFSPYGEYWRQLRKISVVELLSTKRVESFRSVREEEIMNMLEKISSSRGPVNLSELLVSLTNDIVCRVAFGKKYSEEGGGDGSGSANSSSNRYKRLIGELTELLGSFCVEDFVPSLSWIGRLSELEKRVEENSREWDDLLEGIIRDREDDDARRSSDAVDGTVKDFVDVLLTVQKNDTLGFPLTRDHVKALIMDMFAAGTDTTFTAIEWTMAELIRHPEVMKKAQEEVREIAQGKSMVTEDNLHQMNYLKSVIKEALRLHPPIPLLVPRESIESAKVHGYDIPARTRVIVNAWAIGRDPESWEEPEKFQPERFMAGSSKSHVDFRGRDFELIPFGAGRRGCPGIHFATATIECALANLLHRFDWKIPDGLDMDMDEGQGITIRKKTPLLLLPTPIFY